MNQLGRSVYAICRKRNENKILDVFESYRPGIETFNTSIHKNKSICIENK